MTVYCERCEALEIVPNLQAIQRLERNSGLYQSSLDSIVSREPKKPPFTKRGLLDYIIQLIVCEDEVCSVHPY